MAFHLLGLGEDFTLSSNPDPLFGFVDRIGQDGYFHFMETEPADVRPKSTYRKANGYLMLRYTLANERLRIGMIDTDATKLAIEQQRLRGDITKKKWGTETHITADPKELRKFLAEGGNQQIFPFTEKDFVFTRIDRGPR